MIGLGRAKDIRVKLLEGEDDPAILQDMIEDWLSNEEPSVEILDIKYGYAVLPPKDTNEKKKEEEEPWPEEYYSAMVIYTHVSESPKRGQ